MTTLLEIMGDAALALRPGRVVAGFEQVRAMRWLTVAPPTRTTVTAVLDGDDRVRVTIEGHASGYVLLSGGYPAAPAPDRAPLRGERPAPVTARELYTDGWMFHGPRFAGIASIAVLADDGITGAVLSLPARGALLDSAGQLIGHWMQVSHTTDQTVLPTGIGAALWRTAAGRWRSDAELERDAELAAAVPYYRDALVSGTARFFEERRPDCPWCRSADLSVRVRSPDLVLGKPGTFTLEQCGGCGHVFQNPRLCQEGLSFYYRDAYDGLGAADAEMVFASGRDSYLGRARMIEPFTTPKAWLDVGAGHGHFCAVASEIWPSTVFDGLDQGAGITGAERRGWIATAYRGEFRHLAETLAGRYDVISMHHYLEHTRDPLAEVDAAARALPPGGYLLIELPHPQWPLARLFGRYWMPWFQPQHQHMMPAGNLTAALAERGLRAVAIERGPAHQANDFAIALGLLLLRLAPFRTRPWSAREPTVGVRAWRGMVWAAGAPVIVVAALLDRTLCRALAPLGPGQRLPGACQERGHHRP